MAHFNGRITAGFVLGPRAWKCDSLATVIVPFETVKHAEVTILESAEDFEQRERLRIDRRSLL